nr:FecR domain-containing protein [uncultured Draconibacterium sp.]
MNKKLLIKYLNNQCSPSELNEVICWAKNEHLSEETKEQVLETWRTNYENFEIDDNKLNSIFDTIQHKIEADNRRELPLQKDSLNYSAVFKWIFRAAVILLIPVLLFLTHTISTQNEIARNNTRTTIDSLEVIAPLGSRTVVQLSDNTVIHLNSGSKVKYPQIFSGDHREVTLTGEAYFDVAHNEDMPFIVKTEHLNVKVLGTSFNLSAYTSENTIETTLVDGEVQLENAITGEELGVMLPGRHTEYNIDDGAIESTFGEVDKYIAWIDGKLIFEDSPITEVADKLSRMFNVDVIVKKGILDYNYTVTLIDEPLYQILDLMAIATPIKYTILPRKKNADGTYSKQKIILEKKR